MSRRLPHCSATVLITAGGEARGPAGPSFVRWERK